MSLPDLSARAISGTRIEVRATPNAGRNAVEDGDPVRVWVTKPPADGKANVAVRKLLAKALGVAPSRLTLLRGESARDKVFMLD